MFNIGPAELLVVLVIALLVLGPTKLPGAARQVGRALGEMRKLSSGFQAEMRDALKEPVEGKPTTSSKSVSSSTADSSKAGSSKAGSSTADSNGTATGGSLSAPRPPVEPALTSGAAVGDESGLIISDDAVSDDAVSGGTAAASDTHAAASDTHAVGDPQLAAGDTHASEVDAAGDTHAGDTPGPGPGSVSPS